MSYLKHLLINTYSKPRNRKPEKSRKPTLEPLEDRQLLSTCHVTRLSDSGVGKGFRGDLRYCINKVNTEPGSDVIDFTVTGVINLTGALPDLVSYIDIQGPGAELLTIDAKQKARVFYVEHGTIVDISGLTLTGGDAPNQGWGGGIFNAGSLTIQSSSILQNKGGGKGGGVYNQGTLSISNCSISGNTTGSGIGHGYYRWGGGLYNESNAQLFIHGSRISNNVIVPGFSYSALGAGIANLGKAVISYSTISENTANPPFLATWAGFGGGIYNGGELRVDSSLVASNIAAGDFYAYGGGIANGSVYHHSGKVCVINSTITDNLAFANGEVVNLSRGGGISSSGGNVRVVHSTIALNKAYGWQADVDGAGGGISNDGGVFAISNTIVAANRAKTDDIDLWNVYGSVLLENTLTYGDPKLGLLTDNGGPTLTMALLPGSPAIDAGDNTDAPEWDQRGPGFPRIVNGTIDIGAFEVQSSPVPPSRRIDVNLLAVILATADFDSLL